MNEQTTRTDALRDSPSETPTATSTATPSATPTATPSATPAELSSDALAVMPAGRVMDALVAERVMQWKRITLAERRANFEGLGTPGAPLFVSAGEAPYLVPPDYAGGAVGAAEILADGTRVASGLPAYSTDWTAAGLVITELTRDTGLQLFLEYQPTMDWPDEATPRPTEDRWRCAMGISGTDMCWLEARGDTAPLAICRAALDLVPATSDSGSADPVPTSAPAPASDDASGNGGAA